jgi:hypothetical protein
MLIGILALLHQSAIRNININNINNGNINNGNTNNENINNGNTNNENINNEENIELAGHNIVNRDIYVELTKKKSENILNIIKKNYLVLINSFVTYFPMFVFYPQIANLFEFSTIPNNKYVKLFFTYFLFSIFLLVGNIINIFIKITNIKINILYNLINIFLTLAISLTYNYLNDFIYIIILILIYLYYGYSTSNAPSFLKVNNTKFTMIYIICIEVSIILSSLASEGLVRIPINFYNNINNNNITNNNTLLY